MTRVVGVRFRNAGKVYFFAPGENDVKRGMPVIVETARGVEYGTCVNDPSDVEDDQVVAPLKPILRIATQEDIEQAVSNKYKEKEAFKTCHKKIIEHQLDMKLIDAEYTFDNSKILFYFTADGRVDFRELVKDLAGIFRTRIELRQVGVRDETKILGGIGICGRPLCCHSYLADFVPVSIKMAKEQNLSLNPTKISGVCGRLMCCLKNEEEVYEEQNRKLPSVGDYVTTALGERGVVQNVNIFHETVKVLVQNGEDKELKEYKAEEIRFKKHRKRGKLDLSPEEMEQLKALEPEELAALDRELAEEAVEEPEEVAPAEARNSRDNRKERNRSEGGNRRERENDRRKKDNDRSTGDKHEGNDHEHNNRRNRHGNRPNVDSQTSNTGNGGDKPKNNHNRNRNRNRNHRHHNPNNAGGDAGRGNSNETGGTN